MSRPDWRLSDGRYDDRQSINQHGARPYLDEGQTTRKGIATIGADAMRGQGRDAVLRGGTRAQACRRRIAGIAKQGSKRRAVVR